MASAVEVLMSAPEATEDRLVSLVEGWKAIEEVVPRDKLARRWRRSRPSCLPPTMTRPRSGGPSWSSATARCRGFIELLLEVIRFRAVEAGTAVLAMVRTAAAMAKNRRRYAPGDIAAYEQRISGSWRPLVYRNPDLPDGQIDKAAFVLCAIMHLHQALRRRDVFADGAERWSDPRARLLDGDAWQQARPRILTSLELEIEPAGHLAELAGALEGAYARVLAGLGANTAVQFVGGRLQMDKLGAAEEPPLMKELRELLDDMLPRPDFPELLLEVFDRTCPRTSLSAPPSTEICAPAQATSVACSMFLSRSPVTFGAFAGSCP
ncbi:hypothetical protein ACWDRB_46940 [Nonomuraea sp. NPDC003707]